MEVIIAFREERSSLQRHQLHHHQPELVEEEEEEGSYYATAVREEDDEYFEATGSRQHQQQVEEAAAGCHQTEEQLKEFGDYFMRKTKEIIDKKANEVGRCRQLLQDRHLLERKEEEERLRSKVAELERKCGLGAGRVLWQQLAKEREMFVQRQVEEEKEELGKMVVKARKELVATLQLQLEEAREQMQEEEEFVVCKELECPVCLTEMLPPIRVWQCSNGHALCQRCKRNPNINRKCPTCRQQIMGRATTIEKIAASLHYRRTGLSVGVWQEEEEEEVGESEEEEEENSTSSNLSLVLEMLMPGRASQELEVGRLLTNLSRLSGRGQTTRASELL